MEKFKDQAAIVTGGASGIGKATALLLAKQGAKVIVSDLNEENGKEVVNEIESEGGTATFIKTNVAKLEDVENLISKCVELYGRLDIMINNAGIGGPLAFFDTITDEDWDKVIAVNQTGVFYCMRAALKVMKEQRSGKIVNTSSVAGIGSAPRMGAYAASKHAVVGMTTTAATEYGKYGIRINAVCPTVIKTPMGDSYTNIDPMVKEMVKQMIPMKRFGEAEEVAQLISWLCSEESSFITGHAIRVDGGMKA